MNRDFICIFLFAFIANLCHAQKSIDIVTVYKLYCDTDSPVMYDVTVGVSNNVAIYQEKLGTTEPWARPG